MGTPLVGMEGKLYVNDGTYETPDWSELTNVRDVKLSLETDEADVTTRGNAGWRATVPTLRAATLEFEMLWIPGDENLATIRDAYLGGTTLDVLVTDRGSTGEGFRADMRVHRFDVDQSLEEAQKVSVTMRPTLSSHSPVWWAPTSSSSGA